MNCEQFDQYLAEHLEDALASPADGELLAHVEQCPRCREELRGFMRQDQGLESFFAAERQRVESLPNPFEGPAFAAKPAARSRAPYAWAAAAVVVLAAGAALIQTYRTTVPTGSAEIATLSRARGEVMFEEGGIFTRRGTVGVPVHQSDRIKVGEGAYAALALPGAGNILEVRAGTRVTLVDFPDRTQVELDRGAVWAHLPTHPAKPFVIKAGDLTATARGTVYGVEEDLNRTIVRVVEGKVDVADGPKEFQVAAGESYNSLAGSATESLKTAAAWSEWPSALWPEPVQTAAAAAQPLVSDPITTQTAAAPPVPARDLVGLLPHGTVFFVDLKDWPAMMSELGSNDFARLLGDPTLQSLLSAGELKEFGAQVVRELHLLEVAGIARLLTGQVAMGVAAVGRLDQEGRELVDPHFVLLADCAGHEAEVRLIIEQMLVSAQGEAFQESNDARAELARHIRFASGRVIISDSDAILAETTANLAEGGAGGFNADPFRVKMAANSGGAPLTIAFDLADTLTPQRLGFADKPEAMAFYDFVGVGSLDFAITAPAFNGKGMAQAARVGFKERRAGIFAWLAAPRTMRSFGFFSAEVRIFAAAAFSDPRQAYRDVFQRLGTIQQPSRGPAALLQLIEEHKGLLDAMGGEIAMALENPIIPIPNVKVVVEMRDPAAFMAEFGALVGDLSDRVAEQSGLMVVVDKQLYKGREVFSLGAQGSPVDLSWAFVDDFLILGPGPRFVQHSIDVHDSGNSIATDEKLVRLLPSRTGSTFSLLAYQNIAAIIPDLLTNKLMQALPQDSGVNMAPLQFLSRYEAPGIAYAYAEANAIDFYQKAPDGIDFNMGMAVPVVTSWLNGRFNMGDSLEKTTQARRRLDALAAAALIYRQEKNAWPQSPADLTGGAAPFIAAIPEDPFAGQTGGTLQMTAGPGADQLTLYSVGPDGTDQRGAVRYDPVQNVAGGGDIVLVLPLADKPGE